MIVAPKRILVLYWHPEPENEMRAAIRHHLMALDCFNKDQYEVLYHNAFRRAPAWLRKLKFDGIILHTTLLCLRWSHFFYIWKLAFRWVVDSNCPKIAIPQDEYDHSEILDEWLYDWGVSVIFTNFDATHRKTLYPRMHDKAHFCRCLTGYIDEAIAGRYADRIRAPQTRPYDIVYRATHLPYWFGSQGQLKHQIADIVSRNAQTHGLRCNISTRPEDTILGDGWLEFLASGRCVIGCESGSSVLDRRGEIRSRIQAMLRQDPGLSFEEVSERLPPGSNDYRFYAVSPRHFEAVITKTCQVLVEGHYDGVLEADKHYIPLKRDFSNIDQVLKKISDIHYTHTIAEQAYKDVYLSGRYTYKKLATNIKEALSKQAIYKSDSSCGGTNCLLETVAVSYTYSLIRGLSAMARYYLYPEKAILNKPLKPILKKCFHCWRN